MSKGFNHLGTALPNYYSINSLFFELKNSMENRIFIEVSVLEDVFKLAPYLRKDDIQEANALNLTAEQALLRGFVYSEECYSVKYRGEIIGMFGVSEYDMPNMFASVWYFGADECTNHPFTFVRGGIKYINKWLKKYKILINAVDKRNITHINWLRKIGMTISNPIFINGFEFLQFYKLAPCPLFISPSP